MLRSVLARLGVRVGRSDAETEHEASSFTRSLLDASVLFAHGLSRSQADRELNEIAETARTLEEHRSDG